MEEVITVIVPVYNVEAYLDRCINSITGQTYRNLEILLIDDGSSDTCPQLCDDWAERDNRVRVIHKKNAGLGMARNTGLTYATGKYVLFVDSDDYILPHTVERACALAEETEAEIVLFGMNRISRDGILVSQLVPGSETSLFEGESVLSVVLPAMLSSNAYTPVVSNVPSSACTCLYGMELIRRANWRFVSEREILSEDIYSLLKLYRDVRRVAVLKEACYCYCENGSSLTRIYRADRFLKATNCYLSCISLCREYGYPTEVEHSCVHLYLGNTISAMKQAVEALPFLQSRKAIQEMLDSNILQSVFWEQNPEVHNRRAKILFQVMKRKQYGICWFLVYMHVFQKKRKH